MLLTQRKIADLRPLWSTFRGFSLMLEANPASASGPGDGPFANTPATRLVHNQIRAALDKAGQSSLMRELLLGLLPPATWHVTFADLLNEDYLLAVPHAGRREIAEALNDAQVGCLPSLLREIGLQAGVNRAASVRLVYEGFSTLSGSVAALTFAPASTADTTVLSELLAWRDDLLGQLEVIQGPARRTWLPHLTLGYFINRDLAASQQSALTRLGTVLDSALDGCILEHDVVSLFAFRSMADFQRVGDA